MKLEQTILLMARQRLIELESYTKDPKELESVFTRFSALTGLTELARLVDSGLSKNAIMELEKIDQKAFQLMSNIPKIK